MADETSLELTRREVLKLSALAGAGASLTAMARSLPAAAAATPGDFNEATITQLQAGMAGRQFRSIDLVNFYLARIGTLDQKGPTVNSVIELNPDARTIAQALDAERQSGQVRGPLHGVPVLLKDNIDTHDGMQTAAGSLALVGTAPRKDSAVAANLRAAGAVILGKTTLSEWANFRSFFSTSGWSGRGGQCNNPYTVGPHTRTVADAAAVLTAIAQRTPDPNDAATATNRNRIPADYTAFLNPSGLSGARIGVCRDFSGHSPDADAVFETAL